MLNAQFCSVFAWSFSICFLDGLLKPNQYLGRLDVYVSRLDVCEWFCLLFCFIFLQKFGTLINNCVCYLKKKVALVFPQVKLWTHLLFKDRTSVLETEEYYRLYYVPLWCVSGHKFFPTTWKLKRDIWLGYILYINLCINGSLFSWATV